jgi:hypothetical protein
MTAAVDNQTIQRIRYYVEVIRLAVDCLQSSTLALTTDPTSEGKRQQASDCAHSDHGIATMKLDCILNALGVESWPMDPNDSHKLADTPWTGEPDL